MHHHIMSPTAYVFVLTTPSSPSPTHATPTVGYALVTVNGQPVSSRCLPSGDNVLKFLQNPANFSEVKVHQTEGFRERMHHAVKHVSLVSYSDGGRGRGREGVVDIRIVLLTIMTTVCTI